MATDFIPDDDLIIIPDVDTDRYSTFGFISWWQQERVRAATVMVVGAGALGNEVLKALAQMGVGRIFVVDFDTIEVGNLSRSILFRESDKGRRKAEVAAESVREINSDVKVQAFHGDITEDLGLGVFRRMSVIVGCLDNRVARLTLNRACYLIGCPWVDGAIEALMGHARVFWPGRGACYECTLTDRDYQLISMRVSCNLLARENITQGKVPTTPTAASIIGAIQVQEALKIIHDMEVQPGVSIVFNGLTNDSYKTKLPYRESCLSHATVDEIVELPERRADNTTAVDILKEAQARLGPKATMSLGINLVTRLHCSNCGASREVLLPLSKLTESDVRCPVCGNDQRPEVVTDFRSEDADKPYMNVPLAQLGVPPLQIIVVMNDDVAIGLELSGDESDFFDYH